MPGMALEVEVNSREKRLERAQMKVLFTVPFFAPGVAKLGVRFDPSVETACTDGTEIRWNPEFFDKLSDAQLVTVLCHEVCHPMLGHLWRAPSGAKQSQESWDLWNQATDHAVNLMLKEFSAAVMGKRLADPFPFPEPADAYCADPQYAGLAEEVIFGRMASKPPSKGGGTKQGAGQGKGSPGAGSKGASGSKNVAPGSSQTPSGGGNQPGKGSMPGFGQFSQPKASGPDAPGATGKPGPTQKQLQNDWTATLMQSCAIAQGRGELPGSMARLVDALVNPKVPWTEILRSWLREQCSDDWAWSSPAMEYGDSGFILPSLKSERMGPVVFGSDWSGSTYGALVDAFHVEKQAVLDDLRPSKLIDIGFDTRVVWEAEYVPGDTVKRDIKGGGGTSFVDLIRRCCEMHPEPKCLVVLTDGDGEFPKQAPPFPVIWVMYGGCDKAPFGEVVAIK
jgi:predicted metal-dependent peptidase